MSIYNFFPYLLFSGLPSLGFWTAVLWAYVIGVAEHTNETPARRTLLFKEAVHTTIWQTSVMLSLAIVTTDHWSFRWWIIPIGMVATDVYQYFTHRLYHRFPRLFSFHFTHHELTHLSAVGALHNSSTAKIIGGSGLLLLFVPVLRMSFFELSLILTIIAVAVVYNHCPGLVDTDHQKHHTSKVQGNFQEPFGSYLDTWFNTKI